MKLFLACLLCLAAFGCHSELPHWSDWHGGWAEVVHVETIRGEYYFMVCGTPFGLKNLKVPSIDGPKVGDFIRINWREWLPKTEYGKFEIRLE